MVSSSLLKRLIDHCPPGIHLFLATRVDPPLPLTRLRARGQLTEIRATHLQFDATETKEFLCTALGRDVPDEESVALHNRTEGWIAGLHLVVLSLMKFDDQGR